MAILEAMLEKAANLIAIPGNVIPKPGATDGSFVVVGACNKIHVVTPGKGGSLLCDGSCVDHSTKMCEHTLDVAQVTNKLEEFIAWYKRTRRDPKMTGMAVSGGPKSAGNKPSKRKRTNAKSQPVHETVEFLQDPSPHSPKQAKEDLNALLDQRPSMAFANPLPAVHVNGESNGLAGENQSHGQQHFNQIFAQSSVPPNNGLPSLSQSQMGLNNILTPAALVCQTVVCYQVRVSTPRHFFIKAALYQATWALKTAALVTQANSPMQVRVSECRVKAPTIFILSGQQVLKLHDVIDAVTTFRTLPLMCHAISF